MNAYLHIQCVAPNGARGSFLRYADGALASPVCADLAELFPWARANGWREMPYDPAHPCGVYSTGDATRAPGVGR